MIVRKRRKEGDFYTHAAYTHVLPMRLGKIKSPPIFLTL
jgi:hypothetical protein